ncbi:uncharacterized protein LOC129944885 [Eupeodes corollae]|uniref:uncharacterized protein LOC129944885 n=1 Tax=Eupeodes corollae TaxID=290404 RepID=UPI0024937632|nr:uncharacterized protein LOC129944885 [Eupeodes corollae]
MSTNKLLLISLIILLTSSMIDSNNIYFEMSENLERIHAKSFSATVIFVEIKNDFLCFFMKKRSDILVVNFQNSSSLNDINENLSELNIMLVVNDTCKCKAKLKNLIAKIQTRQFVIIFGASVGKLKHSFKFFMEEKFTRIFGSTGMKLYAFYPYPVANTPNSIREVLPTQPIPHALRNLNGFIFRSAIYTDIPRIFKYTDEHGHKKIGGYAIKLFKCFLQQHNATFAEVNIEHLESSFMPAVTQATLSNDIDISLNPYSRIESLGMCYPFGLLRLVILAPINNHIDSNEYFLRPFSPTVWLFFGVTFNFLVAVNVLRNVCRGRPADIWQCLSQIYLPLLNHSTERPLDHGGHRIQAQIQLFAFVIVNVYLVYLTSFLTVFIEIKQFRTIKDLIENECPVLFVNYDWQRFANAEKQTVNFAAIVKTINYGIFAKAAYSPTSMTNNYYAIAIASDKAKFLVKFHKSRRIVEEFLNDYYHLGFHVVQHSPFLDILDDFIIKLMETGLLSKWKSDVFSEVKKYNLINKTGEKLNENNPPLPLTLYHLKFAWICLASGLIFAVLVFICENAGLVVRRFLILLN